MRVRALDQTGDMTFGSGGLNFYQDQPEAVMQTLATRLRLVLGEWFYDTTDGMPWNVDSFNVGAQANRDAIVKARILETQGVDSILSYSSKVLNRVMSVTVTVLSIYSQDIPLTVTVTQ